MICGEIPSRGREREREKQFLHQVVRPQAADLLYILASLIFTSWWECSKEKAKIHEENGGMHHDVPWCTCVHSAMVTLKVAVLVPVLERQRLSRRIWQRIWDINAGGPDLREGGEMSERRGRFWGHLAGKIYLARGMLNKNVPTPLEKHAIQHEHNGIGGWRGQFRSTSCSEGAASRVSEGPLPWQAVETQSLRL